MYYIIITHTLFINYSFTITFINIYPINVYSTLMLFYHVILTFNYIIILFNDEIMYQMLFERTIQYNKMR